MRNTKKGFTLVELLVVIAILAILATVSVVGYTSFIDRANNSNAETELHQIQSYINADLMADNKWEFELEDGTKYVVINTSGKLSATKDGATIGVDVAIKACPDLAGLGTFTVEDDDLVYVASNGEGEARWEGVIPVQKTVTVVIADYATANGWANGTRYSSFVYENISFVATANGNEPTGYTSKYYESNASWRIYQNEAPALTVTAPEGATITSIKITYTPANTGTLTQDENNIASDEVVIVNANSVTFSVGNTGTATNGNIQITSIEVNYEY